MAENLMAKHDVDPEETREWLLSLKQVIEKDGVERALFLLAELNQQTGNLSGELSTPYLNTIPRSKQPVYPGDLELEKKNKALIRWNSAITVARANYQDSSLGGHIGSFASSCDFYDVGFNHFWHAKSSDHGGDCLYIQGHVAPGIYARAYLEGRITEDQMEHFRRESTGKGLSSYPHPWLQPDFWQFPTVSMGIGPLAAIYQARFMKYLNSRGLAKTTNRKVWAFCGDGEMDEPESMGGITRAGREKLDNLIFVINCNLQRLDGLVNGNGKIIQEFESSFRGAGWHVIKVIWGADWENLISEDSTGELLKRLTEICDGDFQTYRSRGGAYMREHLFNTESLKNMVSDLTDDQLHNLTRGGHDPEKIYAAYQSAVNHVGQPTVILFKTVKGYGMGSAGDSRNIAHNQKKMKEEDLKHFREFFNIPATDQQLEKLERIKPDPKSPESQYLHARRAALGGYLPARFDSKKSLEIPHYKDFAARLLKGTAEGREMSTTTAFVQILSALCKDKNIGQHIVPITPDESRTFGMEGLFRQIGIYNPMGQRYEPEDRGEVMYYKEAEDGQILQEGINEAGAICSWTAAATAYSVHDTPMIPFYIYYSMFGFQRVADFCWMASDMRARGFLLGATAGRTTLNGEGLQHEDGHSHIMAGLFPNCLSYDPTYAYELAVIIWEGMRRMYQHHEDVYYYITMMNENYAQRPMPEGKKAEEVEQGILKGLYLLQSGPEVKNKKLKVQLLGSGSILKEVEVAAEILSKDYGVSADIWSVTSANELYREGLDVARHNLLHPEAQPKLSYLESCLAKTEGPIIISTDYVKLYSEQLRQFMPRRYEVLGTDGFGRSDARAALRKHFEVDRYYVVYTALKALFDEGLIEIKVLKEAAKKLGIDPNKLNPVKA